MLAQSGVELDAGDSQPPGRFCLVPPRFPHDLFDRLALQNGQVGGRGRSRSRALRRLQREMLRGNQPALGENRGSFESVPQLAHVAGPTVREQRRLGIGRETGRRAGQRSSDIPQECVNHWQEIVSPIPQWWDADIEYLKPIIQVFPELSALDLLP